MEENTLKRLLVNNLLGKLRQGWGREKKKGKGRKKRKERREGGRREDHGKPTFYNGSSQRQGRFWNKDTAVEG